MDGPSGSVRRPAASVERLIVLAAAYWVLVANRPFFTAALQGRSFGEAATWGFAAALSVLLMALHVLLLACVANRWTVKPLLGLLIVATAGASHGMQAYGVYLDPSMLRNVLRTDLQESRELLSRALLLHLVAYAALPLWWLSRTQVVHRPWRRAVVVRMAFLATAACALVASLLAVFQPFASLMRNHKEIRYLITPANYLWSLPAAAWADARGARGPRRALGIDAAPGLSWTRRDKPLVLLLVVGETARSANWGLSGYGRATTPRLAGLPVVNFPQVQACGTHTEVSLPCMFAPVGRREYDERRIRGQESLLHVVARAGVAVHWRDNQGGCKGVCDGLPAETVGPANAPGWCTEGRCLDEALVHDLAQRLDTARGTQLWVLHMLGSHGPSYYRRYPPRFARFTPDCRHDDLHRCSVREIVNAYDNTLLYTDHVLATAIEQLRAHESDVDSALLYVSDHGESLGEHGLFLHGIPYPIAPEVQTRVPMVLWLSRAFERAAGLVPGCLLPALERRAAGGVAHDHLFHTVLGLLDVNTAVAEPSLNLAHACRAPGEAVTQARPHPQH